MLPGPARIAGFLAVCSEQHIFSCCFLTLFFFLDGSALLSCQAASFPYSLSAFWDCLDPPLVERQRDITDSKLGLDSVVLPPLSRFPIKVWANCTNCLFAPLFSLFVERGLTALLRIINVKRD